MSEGESSGCLGGVGCGAISGLAIYFVIGGVGIAAMGTGIGLGLGAFMVVGAVLGGVIHLAFIAGRKGK